MTGKLMLDVHLYVHMTNTYVDVSTLPSGLYSLEVTNHSGYSHTEQLFIQHP